jgi:hypothetical protein
MTNSKDVARALLNAILQAWVKRGPRNASEVICCPLCGADLRLSRSACADGNVAKCNTLGCVDRQLS